MWAQKFINTIQFKPMDAIGYILATTAILAGFYLFIVGFHLFGVTPAVSTSQQISGIDWLPLVFAVVQVGLGTAWLVALLNKSKSWSLKVRKNCALIFFLVYTFYGFSGLLLNGLTRASWLTTFAMAAVTGVKYLYLASVGDKDGN